MKIHEVPFRGKDVSGTRFGRLIVLRLAGFRRSKLRPIFRMPVWLCRCDCGNHVKVSISSLVSRNTRSCGCLQKEIAGSRFRTHGLKGKEVHPLYYRWYGMIQRCEHPKNKAYKWYGARGIKVCKRWHHFEKWLLDVGCQFRPGLTMDRKNLDLGYSPSNVVWATWEQQRKSRRQSWSLQK